MGQLGKLFREQRESLGLSMSELQARTKIRTRYIEAIEAGDYDVAPGAVYLRGFIRSIATELKLDPEEAVALYLKDLEPPAPQELPTPTVGRAGATPMPAPGGVARLPDKVHAPVPRAPVAPTGGAPTRSATPTRSSSSRAVTERPKRKRAKQPPRLLWLVLLLTVLVLVFFLWDKLQPPPVVEVPDPPPPPPVVVEPKEPEPPPPAIVLLTNPDERNPIYTVNQGPLEVVLQAENERCWIGAKVDTVSEEATLDPKGTTPSITLEGQANIVVRVGNPRALRVIVNQVDLGLLSGDRPLDLTIRLTTEP